MTMGDSGGGLGRERRSAAEGRALVEQWRQSGQTAAAYCRRPGTVAVHTLRYWIAREKPSKGLDRKEGDFFVVSTPREAAEGVPQSATDLEDNVMGQRSTDGYTMRNAIIMVLPETDTRGLAQTVQALLREGLA